jgi:hypothetical protein
MPRRSRGPGISAADALDLTACDLCADCGDGGGRKWPKHLLDCRHGLSYSVKRDLDEKRGQYLLLAAFGQESDARELAQAIGAETIRRYPGYASQRGVKYGSKFQKTLRAAVKRGKTGKRLQEEPANKPA